MHFIVGAPGAGKTVLGLQTAFCSARAGSPVLFLTTLSESHDKLLAHASSLGFFDPEVIGNGLELINLRTLIATSIDATVDGIVAAIRRNQVALVIVDGFAGLRGLFESESSSRQFLYELGTKLSLLGVTLLINIEASLRDTSLYPELTVADGLIGLFYERVQGGHRRYVEVLKLRGTRHLPGLHTMRIEAAGLRCYPQLEALPIDRAEPFGPERIAFDLPELDRMLGGGLNGGTVTMLAGSPGTGKTLLCLHYLMAGAARNEPGLLIGFDETDGQLCAKAEAFGQDLHAATRGGLLSLYTAAPVWLDPDVVAQELMVRVQATGVRRLVVDPISAVVRSLPPDRVPHFAAALVGFLRSRGVTTLLTQEVPTILGDALEFTDRGILALTENLILLRQVEYRAELHRVLSILKMRFSAYDHSLREFVIAERGISVRDKLSSAEGILTGTARDLAGEAS